MSAGNEDRSAAQPLVVEADTRVDDEDIDEVILALEASCIEGGTGDLWHCSWCRCVETVKRLATATSISDADDDPSWTASAQAPPEPPISASPVSGSALCEPPSAGGGVWTSLGNSGPEPAGETLAYPPPASTFATGDFGAVLDPSAVSLVDVIREALRFGITDQRCLCESSRCPVHGESTGLFVKALAALGVLSARLQELEAGYGVDALLEVERERRESAEQVLADICGFVQAGRPLNTRDRQEVLGWIAEHFQSVRAGSES